MAKRPGIATSIDLGGPFFRNDPGKTFRQNVQALMEDIATEGEADVKAQLRQGESSRAPLRYVQPDRVAAHVVGRTQSLRGRQWQLNAVISVNNTGLTARQGISLMAAASELERRSHVFRRTSTRLRKVNKLNAAELLKGIAD